MSGAKRPGWTSPCLPGRQANPGRQTGQLGDDPGIAYHAASMAEHAPTGSSRPSPAQANYALGMLLAAYILSFVDRQVLSLLVEPIKRDLGISDLQISYLQGLAFALFYALMGLPLGRLADRFSRRWLIGAGIGLWSIATCLCGLARNYSTLFLARVGVGVGEAALSPAAYSMLSDYFPPRRLARATSIFSLGIPIGGGLAYLAGGAVISLTAGQDKVLLPLAGALAPWQLVFIAVGLPGLLLAGLMATVAEPPRGSSSTSQPAAAPDIPVRQVLSFLHHQRQFYLPFFLGISLLSVVGYGTLAWYPSFFIRSYQVPLSQVGLYFGLVYLLAGCAGTLAGAQRGHADAEIRWVSVAPALILPPALLAPLMPSFTLALLVSIGVVFTLNVYFGVAIAALQLATPDRMRGQFSALMLLMTNLLGLGAGPTLVAGLTDLVFARETALRYSLMVMAALACPLAALLLRRALPAYNRQLARLREQAPSPEAF